MAQKNLSNVQGLFNNTRREWGGWSLWSNKRDLFYWTEEQALVGQNFLFSLWCLYNKCFYNIFVHFKNPKTHQSRIPCGHCQRSDQWVQQQKTDVCYRKLREQENKSLGIRELPKTLKMVPTELRYKDVGVHMPVALESYKRCKLCSTKTNDKRSKVKCEKCDVALCIVPCFRQFHCPWRAMGIFFPPNFPGVSRFFFNFSWKTCLFNFNKK